MDPPGLLHNGETVPDIAEHFFPLVAEAQPNPHFHLSSLKYFKVVKQINYLWYLIEYKDLIKKIKNSIQNKNLKMS